MRVRELVSREYILVFRVGGNKENTRSTALRDVGIL